MRKIYVILIYLFMYFPIATVILMSFNDSVRSMVWHGFTWKWYIELIKDKDIIDSGVNSVVLAMSSSVISTFLGIVFANAIVRYNFFMKKLVHNSIMVTIVIPEIVLGISMLLLYNLFNIELGFSSVLIGHIAICFPFATINIINRLMIMDNKMIEVAKDLGASELMIMRKIIVPFAYPTILSSFLLNVTMSLDDFIVSYFTSSPNFITLPIRIYSSIRLGVQQHINALCSIIFLLTLIFISMIQFLNRKLDTSIR